MILPDLDSLRCFDAAAHTLNFRQAAAAVALSPTAFSDRIQRLEHDLGALLFERTTRRVALTAAGLRLWPHARRALEEARQCGQAVRDPGWRAPFELTVGTRFELGLSWLVPALEPLRAERPERTVHLRFGDSPDLLQALRAGGVDCVVSSIRFASGGLHFAPLHEEDYVFVAQTELAAARPLRGPEDAPGHVLLDAHPDLPLFRYCLDALAADGAPVERAQGPALWSFARTELLGTIAAIRFRALQGAGVAVLPRYFVACDLAAGRLVELLPGLQLARDRFRLIWPDAHPLRTELLALAEALRAMPLQ